MRADRRTFGDSERPGPSTTCRRRGRSQPGCPLGIGLAIYASCTHAHLLHPDLPLLSTTTRCSGTRTESGSLFADTLQDFGEVLILQDRNDRHLHQITPHESEFGQSLGILAL